MRDLKIDPKLLEFDIPDYTEELDALLRDVAKDRSLQELPGMEAGQPPKIDREEMRRRHLRAARLLQRAGLRYFIRKGQRPPGAA